ncbi:hypothetical protein Fmac_018256 [Flemingia macrophylla]|uniref:Uncharacterized protein n=1 Tax=Flemingia macrophylla TaxID=520843 RepID=A0ABD1M4G3_9FABA
MKVYSNCEANLEDSKEELISPTPKNSKGKGVMFPEEPCIPDEPQQHSEDMLKSFRPNREIQQVLKKDLSQNKQRRRQIRQKHEKKRQ